MTTLVPFDPAKFDRSKLPDVYGAYDENEYADLASGVHAGFAVLSIRGKVWRVRFAGEEHTFTDKEGNPRPVLPMVIVGWSKYVSKTYYRGTYKPNSDTPPDCRSMDGLRPDPDVPEPVNDVCATCPMNQWGSATNPDTSTRGKACSDGRRIAVLPGWDFDNEAFGGPMMLRVPTMSLEPLKYLGQQLKEYQLPLRSVVVGASFDPATEFQKINFKILDLIADKKAAEKILTIARSPRVKEMVDPPVAAEPVAPAASNVVNLRAKDAPGPNPAKPSASVPRAQKPTPVAPVEPDPVDDMEELLAGFEEEQTTPQTKPTRKAAEPEEDLTPQSFDAADDASDEPETEVEEPTEDDDIDNVIGDLLKGLEDG